MTKQSKSVNSQASLTKSDRHADARDDNIPQQYQKGYAEFYKLKFKVTPDVLIPRPETELLVDEVLNYYTLNPIPYTLLDIGTGAGNIAIALACNLKACLPARQGCNVKIIAADVSAKALKVAKQNVKLHGVENQITFIQSNLLSNIIFSRSRSFDIIVTNLPYIPSARIPYLDSSVKDFEPLVALDGGDDGFDLYRKLFAQIKEKGWNPKLIVGEIDYTHGELAINEAEKYFPDSRVEVKTDLTHRQRILKITN